MKKFIGIFSIFISAVYLFSACTKADDLPFYDNGTPVVLTASKTSVVATPADSTKDVITLSWTSPKYAQDSSKYKYIVELDSSGRNFAKETIKILTGATSMSFTGKELNAILLNYGFNLGQPYSVDVRVTSSYGNNNERLLSNVVKLTVTPYSDPSVLTSSQTTISPTLSNASLASTTFTWTPSFNGYTGGVTYSIQYDSAGKNFASPKEIAVGTSVFSKTLTQGEMNNTALDEGVPGGNTGKIEYRIKAVTAQGAVAYSNAVAVTINSYFPLIKMYIVGSINGWDINNPLQLRFDSAGGRFNKVYYTYISMNAGDAFKFVQKPGDWSSAYGNMGASGTGFNTGMNQGGDFQISSAGVYRLTIDIGNNKAYVQQKQVGIVGNMQGWNPAAPNYGGLAARDLFLIITNSSGTDAFKFHDGPVWDNGTPDKARWWGKGAVAGTLDHDGNGGDIVASFSPRTRAIWDGRDPRLAKYELSPADQMRVVGDGIQGVAAWNPGASPQMTYMGNGKWQITIGLVANKSIKFLGGPDWGAFDYEDNSGGSTALGVARKIKWDGGGDFKTPTVSGTYTIVLDEHAQTVTIN